MRNKRALTSLVVVVSLLTGALATGGAADAQRRGFCGVVRVRPPACLIVSGGIAARTDYDISSARPRPRRGITIVGSGFVRGPSRCVPGGRRLSNVTWRRAVACPQAR